MRKRKAAAEFEASRGLAAGLAEADPAAQADWLWGSYSAATGAAAEQRGGFDGEGTAACVPTGIGQPAAQWTCQRHRLSCATVQQRQLHAAARRDAVMQRSSQPVPDLWSAPLLRLKSTSGHLAGPHQRAFPCCRAGSCMVPLGGPGRLEDKLRAAAGPDWRRHLGADAARPNGSPQRPAHRPFRRRRQRPHQAAAGAAPGAEQLHAGQTHLRCALHQARSCCTQVKPACNVLPDS